MTQGDGHRRGFVSLVGAGPGDPDLLTIGGAARLAEADVVVYDHLANPVLLSHARPGAELIYVGKTTDRHTLTQEQINALLVEQGLAGKRVVRLKGGDPFVFGRGGEEAEDLIAAGIPFEVLPGVTSAIAAPAYAGIPVTHRGVASSFAVITGHEDPSKEGTSIDWAHLATGVDTLVFLMGTGRLREIAQQLVEHGRPASTPAAVIEWGTLPRQRTATGTLATIADAVREAGIEPPAVTVVGEVARLREGLRWFDARPLFGKRVLVTRTRQQASELSRALAAQGAEPVELPTLEIVPTYDEGELATAIVDLKSSAYSWVVFTSANAVELFAGRIDAAGLDARAFGRTRIAAIGPGTAEALRKRGLRADLVPDRFVAEGLVDAFSRMVVRGQRVLLPRAEGARELLVDALASMGADVHDLRLYRAQVPAERNSDALRRLRAGEIDVATFASSSAVRNLVDMLGGDVAPLRDVFIAAIGPVTADAVRAAGLDRRRDGGPVHNRGARGSAGCALRRRRSAIGIPGRGLSARADALHAQVEPGGHEFHDDERVAAAAGAAADAEARFLERPLRARVPVERLQVDAAEARRPEDDAYQGLDGVGAVALAPVVALADRDADLRLAPDGVDVVVHRVADVLPAHVFDREAATVRARVGQFVAEQRQVVVVGRAEGPRGVEARQFGVGAPAEVVVRIAEPLLAQHDEFAARDLAVDGRRHVRASSASSASSARRTTCSSLRCVMMRSASSAGNQATRSYSPSCSFTLPIPDGSMRKW